MKEQDRRYALVVKKKRIEVTEEVYKAYYKLTERERYLGQAGTEPSHLPGIMSTKRCSSEFLIIPEGRIH